LSPTQFQSRNYWINEFAVSQGDIEFLTNTLLERETPLTSDEMALILIRYHLSTQAKKTKKRKAPAGIEYRPADEYADGAILSFSALGGVEGKVVSVREGINPDYDSFSVIEIEFDDGTRSEFASNLPGEHPLNVEEEIEEETEEALTPEELFIEFGGIVAEQLEDMLEEHDDLVRLAGYWFPRSLLIEVNQGHLNLAEAILDMMEGGPLATLEIMEQVGVLQDVNPRLAEFSMNYGLQQDERFDEVGPAGRIMWHLVRMEPPEAITPPELLAYEEEPYEPGVFSGEMLEIIEQIGDELSHLPKARIPSSGNITLPVPYPHLRSGTLPLSAALRRMFPTAYTSPRIHFTLVDPETQAEMPGWVVRNHGYMFGLRDWFIENEVPVGAYLTVERTQPGIVEVGLQTRNPRSEWVPTLVTDGKSVQFEDQKHKIACEYDDLMIIYFDDPDMVDELRNRYMKSGLARIVDDFARALIKVNPQGNVHVRTLYSAVNMVRRCPPEPIIYQLQKLSQFAHVGGPYWQLEE